MCLVHVPTRDLGGRNHFGAGIDGTMRLVQQFRFAACDDSRLGIGGGDIAAVDRPARFAACALDIAQATFEFRVARVQLAFERVGVDHGAVTGVGLDQAAIEEYLRAIDQAFLPALPDHALKEVLEYRLPPAPACL